MSLIQIENLSFTYPGSLQPVFQNVNIKLDTGWRLGLIGRNGRGKTTFLNLLQGKLKGNGFIHASEQMEYFPLVPQDPLKTALAVARQAIAPFDAWELEMEKLAAAGTEAAMQRYGEVQEAYQLADGYAIDELIAAETGRLDMAPEVLQRAYASLSGGEKVKLMLAALFLKKHTFLLIDEPTDHLDTAGRQKVARWLAGKKGFILVSHDRAFLDTAIDHVLSINKTDIELQNGNYTSWRENRTRQDEFERAQNDKLEASIARLEQAARRTERWSDQIEKSKMGGGQTYNKGPASVDKGYIGHQAARMMQRSKAIQQRRGREIEEKQSLLKNVEQADPLKIWSLDFPKKRLVTAQGLSFGYGSRLLFRNLTFALDKGERMAVQGANGTGKTSLLRIILGQQQPTGGLLQVGSGLVMSTLPQDTDFLKGSLQSVAGGMQLDTSLFLTILRKLDFEREAFGRPVEGYSAGQKKKVCLAASLARPAHLFVWDEPLNYIDVLSREQIENAILEYAPTLLFVEHDERFVQRVATQRLNLCAP